MKPTSLQVVLYRVFLVTCVVAATIGLLLTWDLCPGRHESTWGRLLVTSMIVAVASALLLSANRMMTKGASDDGR